MLKPPHRFALAINEDAWAIYSLDLQSFDEIEYSWSKHKSLCSDLSWIQVGHR